MLISIDFQTVDTICKFKVLIALKNVENEPSKVPL